MKDQLTDRPKCSEKKMKKAYGCATKVCNVPTNTYIVQYCAHLLSRDRATLRGIFFCLAFIYLYSSNNMIAK